MSTSSSDRYISRELSWLAFNLRVLQEAEDSSVPLIERLRFLGIYSNNRDEFFRVRVASLKRMIGLRSTAESVVLGDPEQVLDEIEKQTLKSQKRFWKAYEGILKALAELKIFIIDERGLTNDQAAFVSNHFEERVRPVIQPIMLDLAPEFPYLRDKSLYFVIHMKDSKKKLEPALALLELPTENSSRFLVLPKGVHSNHIMLIDDVIRHSLPSIFPTLKYDQFAAYAVKITRDAELDLDDDISRSVLERMTRGLEKRKKGVPTRFVYDSAMPPEVLDHITKSMRLKQLGNLIPSGRYHNFKDFIGFPFIGYKKLRFKDLKPIAHPDLPKGESIFQILQKKDVLMHYPYHSFMPEIDLLREASIDPNVTQIKITLYRVAHNSNIVRSLLTAIQNGKKVTAVVELQARFDEQSNMYWSKKLEEAGAKVIYGVAGLKVHSKLMLINRNEGGKASNYVRVGTGNFNGDTSKIYSDYSLLTSHFGICDEVESVFNFYGRNFEIPELSHLLSSPFNMRSGIERLIMNEMDRAANGEDAYIIFKLNNLVDKAMIDLLYKASQAGVKIKLLVRGMFSLKAGVKGLSQNIEARSIVGRFLEHSRVLIFGNGGNELMYTTSADLMTRNLDHRSEVAVPIYDKKLRKQIRSAIDTQFKDNQKARILDPQQLNKYVSAGGQSIDSQMTIYNQHNQA
jgi:polyphosphate kinase